MTYRKERAISAITCTFPTIESFTAFSSNIDNSPIIDSFIDFAARNCIIYYAELESLEQWLRNVTSATTGSAPPRKITFEELLNRKGKRFD